MSEPRLVPVADREIPVLVDHRSGVRFPVDLPSNPRQERIAAKYMAALSPDDRVAVQIAVQRKRLQAPTVPPLYQRTKLWQDISAAVMRGSVE